MNKIILYGMCLFMLLSSVFALDITHKQDGEKVYDANGLQVEFEHIINSPRQQSYDITFTSDEAQTIDPDMILSQFNGTEVLDLHDFKTTYIQYQEGYEYYTKWCTDHTYSECQKNQTDEYSINGGQGQDLVYNRVETTFPKSLSQLSLDGDYDYVFNINDIVLDAGIPKTIRFSFTPDQEMSKGTYGLFSLVVDDVEYYDTTDSSDFNVSDVIFYYTFDDDDLSGNTVLDLTDNDNDGTNNGATTGVSGVINEAFDFDGSNDYVNTNYNNNFNSNEMTVNAWYSIDSTGYDIIVGRLNSAWGSAPDGSFILTTRDSNELNVQIQTSSGYFSILDGSYTADEYIMVTFTYDGSTMKLYKNGELIGSKSVSGTIDESNEDIFVGRRAYSTSPSYFNGKIDEVMILHTALTQEQIEFLYADGSPTEEQQYPFIFPTNPINITFSSQNPSDVNQANIEDGVTINYTITNLNESASFNPYLNYTTTDGAACFQYENQECVRNFNEYEQIASQSNSSDVYSWFIPCTSMIPQTSNLDFSWIVNEPKNFLSIPTNTDEPKVTLYNVSTSAEYYLLEAYLNASSALDVNVYACDDSYTTGNFFTECTLVGTMVDINESDVVNFGDGRLGNHSFYNVLRMSADDGVVNGLQFTETMQFIFEADDPFTVAYVNNDTGTLQTANGNGNSYDDVVGTADVFLRYFDGTEDLTYQACGEGQDGEINCSLSVVDPFDAVPIIPTAPSISMITPLNGESFVNTENVNVTWNAFDANNDTLSYSVTVDEVTLASGLSSTSYSFALSPYSGSVPITVTASDGSLTASDTHTILVSTAPGDGTVVSTPFNWTISNPEPELFECPTNILQFALLAGVYMIVFVLFGSSFLFTGAARPLLLFTAGLLSMILPFYVVGCSVLISFPLWLIGLILLFSSVFIVKF